MLRATVDLSGVKAALGRIPEEVVQEIAKKVRALTIDLQRHIIANKLSGQVLNRRSGALSRSIQTDVKTTDQTTIGSVYSAGDVKYAGIHEFGGRTKPHDIFPDKAQALAFMVNGQQVFARHVRHPGSQIPERSFMRSSLNEKADEIMAGIRAAAIKGAKKAMAQ